MPSYFSNHENQNNIFRLPGKVSHILKSHDGNLHLPPVRPGARLPNNYVSPGTDSTINKGHPARCPARFIIPNAFHAWGLGAAGKLPYNQPRNHTYQLLICLYISPGHGPITTYQHVFVFELLGAANIQCV